MPSVLLPHIIKQQEKMERERKRANPVMTEDKVVAWFVSKLKEDNPDVEEAFTRPEEYICYSYDDFINEFRADRLSALSRELIDYFDYDRYIIDLWKSDFHSIVYADGETLVALEDADEKYPIWKGRLDEFFTGHPCKKNFYILRLDV